ncbi:hypothetical protein [Gramella sp. AN32]|uniref:Tyr recombinase domain-containing protein n=1 Tax=Christiangramia antarctica TaxID=2058158 RepID=A0ABW5X547_9FLAO|nr:hypothetical protein [Gramella sp. AN32]MCM4158218.1 hypothetical protein [Gramella sp. AN32]
MLKKIVEDAGIDEKITSYYFSNFWTTSAKDIGISTKFISEGLGHHFLITTEIYLKSFDDAKDLVVA